MNQDHCLVEQFEMIFRAHFSSVKFLSICFLNRKQMRKIWLKMYLPNYGLILRRGKIMMEKKGIYTLWQKCSI